MVIFKTHRGSWNVDDDFVNYICAAVLLLFITPSSLWWQEKEFRKEKFLIHSRVILQLILPTIQGG